MPLFNLSTTQALLVVHAGDDPGIIINRDLVDSVLFGTEPAFPLISASVIDALTFIQYSGDTDIWALATVAPITIDVQPNNQNWSPSPAQAAASIATSGLALESTQAAQLMGIPANIAQTGVPLLTRNTVLSQQAGNLAAAATFNVPQFMISQPSYHAFFSAIDNSAGTQHRTIKIQITWSDSASGQTVQIDSFYILPGASGASPHQIVGDGPSKGDTVNIAITNNDTAQIAYVFTFSQSSRVFRNDVWRSLGNAPISTGFQVGGMDVPGLLLIDTGPTVSAGGQQTRLLPLYTGPVSIMLNTTTGTSGPAIYDFHTEDPAAANYGIVMSQQVASGGKTYIEGFFGNSQTYLIITNNGTSSGACNVQVTAVENG